MQAKAEWDRLIYTQLEIFNIRLKIRRMKRLILLAALSCMSLNAQEFTSEAMKPPKAAERLLLDNIKTGNGRLLVVGERGHILFSDDNGSQWQQAIVPTSATLTTIARAGDVLIAAGHDTTILRSTDAGANWQLISQAPENEKPILDVFFSDDKNGFAVGAYGYFARTVDAGVSWTSVEIAEFELPEFGFPHIYRMTKTHNGELLVVGEAGFFARSSDQGHSWKRQTFPYEGTLFSVFETKQQTLLVSGMRGHLFRSADAGATFNQIETGVRSGLNDISQSKDGLIIVAGMDGMVLTSADDGAHIKKEQRPNRKAIASVASLTEQTLLLTAEDGASVYTLNAVEK